jgi:hypothetical protein
MGAQTHLIDEFDFELTQYSGSDPEAYSVKNHDREVAHLRLRHGVFTVWAWRPGESDPVEIFEKRCMSVPAEGDRFKSREQRDEVLAAGLKAVQSHLRRCRTNTVAIEPSASALGMSPA